MSIIAWAVHNLSLDLGSAPWGCLNIPELLNGIVVILVEPLNLILSPSNRLNGPAGVRSPA